MQIEENANWGNIIRKLSYSLLCPNISYRVNFRDDYRVDLGQLKRKSVFIKKKSKLVYAWN